MKPFSTSCRDCVFATYSPGPNGVERQDGCLTGRLDVYEKLGVVSGQSDGQKEWNVIDMKLCNLCRAKDSPWHEANKDREMPALAREEVQPRYKAVVIADAMTTVEGLKHSLECVYRQEIRPKSVAVLLIETQKDLEEAAWDIVSTLFKQCRHTVSTLFIAKNWKDAISEEYLANRGEYQTAHPYQLTLLAGYEVSSDFVQKVDAEANDHLTDCSLIEVEEREDAPPLWCNAQLYFEHPKES